MAVKLFSYITILLGMCQMFREAATQHCSGKEESISNMMLRCHIYKKITGAPLGDVCLRACYRDDRCQSFNYVIWQDVCEMNNRTKEARPEDFVSNADRYYFKRDCGRVPLGSTPKLPAETCKKIKASEGRQAVSGKYWFDSIIPGATLLAHCDMKKEDVDECSTFISVCDVNAKCQNTRGSYRCSCKPGYTGDGKTCADVDECSASVSVCDVNAKCQNTRGSYRCSCKPGYTGDGKTCADIDECAINKGGCSDGCQNLQGTYQCTCPSGFEVDQTKKNCIDVDECSASVSVCDVNAKCQNTRGSYRCSCKAGFTGDGKTCTALSLTATNSCAMVQLTSTSGIIRPNQSSQYTHNMDCRWNFSSNAMLELVFYRFNTEPGYDFVYVYDGGSLSSPLIGRFAGSSIPAPITSSSNNLYVRFTTDHSGLNGGFVALYNAFASGTLRLNGSMQKTGRVEVSYDGQWGTVCDDAWDINDANVVCRQLGYLEATHAYSGATHGQGTGPIWMDDLVCSGSESHIYDCRHSGWGKHSCSHSEDASVQCSSRVRLVNGGSYYGRVEVYHSGQWGTVCDNNWDMTDANVLCRQLGFYGASSAPGSAKYGQGSNNIWLDQVNCQGVEASLLDCTHRGWGVHGCGHHQDAGVVCNT